MSEPSCGPARSAGIASMPMRRVGYSIFRLLPEDQQAVMDKIKTKALTLDQTSLRSLAEKFGKVGTRKIFKTLLQKSK